MELWTNNNASEQTPLTLPDAREDAAPLQVVPTTDNPYNTERSCKRLRHPYNPHLRHTTSDSLLSMNGALCRYQRCTQRESYRGILSEEWFVQQEQQRRTHALQQLTAYIQQPGNAMCK
jgi:hypothetical protein